ncbi:MAG: hypothetical protein GWN73_22885, partial [Actinobacteria bacterium]|nr:hypothetical protein [Actinomycetota bacterium]NIU68102.1 hypothetical protein [Actinomycetota bacterium]
MPAEDSRRTFAEPSRTSLDPERIVYTIAKLHRRIEERFPGSGLGSLCDSLRRIGEETRTRLDEVERPILWLRTLTWLMAGLVIVGVVAAIRAVLLEIPEAPDNAFAALQILE